MLQIGEISSATLRQIGSYSISNKRYIKSISEKYTQSLEPKYSECRKKTSN